MATEKQIDFIASLLNDRDVDPNVAKVAGNTALIRGLGPKAASALIDALLASPRKAVANLQEGYYHHDGVYYVVVPNRAGTATYTKRLTIIEPDCGGCTNGEPCGAGCRDTVKWVYDPKGKALLVAAKAEPISLEEAKAFGKLYGSCIKCGRLLTNPESVEAGIGPVCAKFWE